MKLFYLDKIHVASTTKFSAHFLQKELMAFSSTSKAGEKSSYRSCNLKLAISLLESYTPQVIPTFIRHFDVVVVQPSTTIYSLWSGAAAWCWLM